MISFLRGKTVELRSFEVWRKTAVPTQTGLIMERAELVDVIDANSVDEANRIARHYGSGAYAVGRINRD